MFFAHQLKLLKHENHYWYIGFVALVTALTVHALFIPLFWMLGVRQLALLNVGSVAIYLYCLFGLADKTLMTHNDRAIGWLVYFELLIHAFAATYYLGTPSGFHYYVYLLVLLPFFTQTQTKREFIVRLAGIVGISFYIRRHFTHPQPFVDIPDEIIMFMGDLNLISFLLIGAIIVYLYTAHEKRYTDDLVQHSLVDPLTSLYNRRYFGEYAEKMFANKTFKERTVALSIVDIDHFKSINDRYGHESGDIVIKEVAQRLKSLSGSRTLVSRWGGEEFALLHWDTDKVSLERTMHEIVSRIAAKPIDIGETAIEVTVTAGSALRKENEIFRDLFVRADEALYTGKRNGRNTAVVLP